MSLAAVECIRPEASLAETDCFAVRLYYLCDVQATCVQGLQLA